MVDSIPTSIDLIIPLESEVHTTQVLLFSSYGTKQGGMYLILMKPPPSNEIIFFDWNQLRKPYLPSYMPFQVMVNSCDKDIFHTLIDEGSFVSILSLTDW